MSRAFFSACFGLVSALQPSPRAPSVSWSSIRMSGCRAGAGKHVEFHSEFLDAARFSGQFQEEHQRDFLKEKYRDYPPDLVIGVSGSAVAFLMKYRESMFTGGPAVYLTWQGEVPCEGLAGQKSCGNIYTRRCRGNATIGSRSAARHTKYRDNYRELPERQWTRRRRRASFCLSFRPAVLSPAA